MDVANETLPHDFRLEGRGNASYSVMGENFVPVPIASFISGASMEKMWAIRAIGVAGGGIRCSQSAAATTFRVWSDLGFLQSVCGFLVMDGEEDDLGIVDGLIMVACGGKQLAIRDVRQRCIVNSYVAEIGRQCCCHNDDLASVRVKMMKIGGHDIARERVG
ncbi:hypothetical protein V8G54_013305 [Vigna mungo]|uniref:Uncharacterized protein n=1 Tax=Vigna mungo TaxID=3915 RepID=A0AAQ3S4T7_VIGMU